LDFLLPSSALSGNLERCDLRRFRIPAARFGFLAESAESMEMMKRRRRITEAPLTNHLSFIPLILLAVSTTYYKVEERSQKSQYKKLLY
jgi:hypothetical protein